MIVQCTKCHTKFSFPETELEGEGVWLKCGSCGNLFFQENPDHIEPPSQPSKEDILAEDDAQLRADLAEIRAELSGPYKRGMEPKRGKLLPALKWGGIAAAMLLAAGVVYFVVFPDVGHNLLNEAMKHVPFSKELGLKGKDASPVNTGIDFMNVREKFVKNWIVGDIMVIQGTAVNKSNKPVSMLKIKARLLDQAGQFIAESSSYAGDIFTEEELLNLTEQEIVGKLSLAAGSEYPNKDIAPDASIPFLIVFIKPPPKASEYIVELDNMETPK